MFQSNPCLSFLRLASVLIGFVLPLVALQAADKGEARLRLVCVTAIPGEKEMVLASRDENGGWKDIDPVQLRASSITGWLSAKAGEMHLAVRQDGAMKSICDFQYPADSRRALVVLVANVETESYKAHVLDLDKIEFTKGSLCVVNFSEQDALVKLGSNERKIGPGQQEVVKPGKEDDATYRQMVSYLDPNGKEVLCHDRHVPGNADSREMLFILQDKILGLKVANLPIFGSLD